MSAAAEQKTTEPSMEEILASIRRIISDDQQQAAPVVAQAPVVAVVPPAPKAIEQPKPVPVAVLPQVPTREAPPIRSVVQVQEEKFQEPEEDVFELTMPAPELVKEAVLSHPEFVVTKVQEPVALRETVASVAHVYVPEPVQSTSYEDRLIEGKTDTLVSNSFGSLAHTVLSQNARTLDDVVKDMLRPMLKSWLDDNLPNVVEHLVRSEIERVTRGGR
jgi:uncharacterized protein